MSGRAVMCEHANEVPQTCPCARNCYCKAHTCKERTWRDRYTPSGAWELPVSVDQLIARLSLRKRETPALKKKRERLKKAMALVQKLSVEVRAECPHVPSNVGYKAEGREDTLGNYKAGMDCEIRCFGCDKVLERWSE